MSKLDVQKFPIVLDTSGSLAATSSVSGSLICHGYARLVGVFRSDVDTETGSGLIIEQSANLGSNWDLVSASDLIAASTSTGCSIEILGDAIRVTVTSGASAASALRTSWRLRPV